MAPTSRTALRLAGIRLLSSIILGFVVVSAVFVLSELYTPTGGDPVYPSVGTVLTERYPQYLGDVLRFDLGVTERVHTEWHESGVWPFNIRFTTTAVGAILANRVPMSLWLIGWTTLISGTIGLTIAALVGRTDNHGKPPGPSAFMIVVRGVAVVFLANVMQTFLAYSDRFVNVDWPHLFVTTPPIASGLSSLPELLTVNGFLVATKWAIPPALVASTAVVPTVYRIGHRGIAQLSDGLPRYIRTAVGGPIHSPIATRNTLLVWGLESLPGLVALLTVSSLVAETYFRAGTGLARVIAPALLAGEPALLAGITAILLVPIVVADLIREVGIYWMTGSTRRRPETVRRLSIPAATDFTDRFRGLRPVAGTLRRPLRSVPDDRFARLRANPWPALGWVVAGVGLIVLEIGAIRDVIMIFAPGLGLPEIPTLVSWTTIPDAAHQTPGGEWTGGFLGLSPALAWTARLLIAAAYLTGLVVWVWFGVRLARVVYTDRDAELIAGAGLEILRSNDRLKAGCLLVLLIGSVGVFAPAIAPSMADNPDAEFHQQHVTYLNPETREVEDAIMVQVVADMDPDGSPGGTTGLLEYDAYGRFHPLGVAHENLPGLRPNDRTYDVFSNLAMNLQGVVRLTTLTALVMLAATLVLGVVTIKAPTINRVLVTLSDRVLLVPFFLLAVFTYRVPGSGRTGVQAFTQIGLGRDDPQMPWFRQPEFGLHHVVMAVVAALVLVRVIHRIVATIDTDSIRSTVRRGAVPVLGHACLLLAGITVIIVTGRLLRFEHPSATIAFDIRVPLDFLWIDTALWYRHIVPMLVQYSLGIGLALIGDGLCQAAGDRADPESQAPTETNAGGGGG